MKRVEENGCFGATLLCEESLGFMSQMKVSNDSGTPKKLGYFSYQVSR
jgi:hypothetical protein